MKRQGKVLLVAHCVFNMNTVVYPLARQAGTFERVAALLAESGLGLEIMGCPEIEYLGMERKPMSKNEYGEPAYWSLCTQLAEDTQHKADLFAQADIAVVGVLGIEGSPTCSIGGDPGWLMLALGQQPVWDCLAKLDIPVSYLEGDASVDAQFEKKLADWLQNLG